MADLKVPSVLLGTIPTHVKRRGRKPGSKNKPKEEPQSQGAVASPSVEEYSEEELEELTAPPVARTYHPNEARPPEAAQSPAQGSSGEILKVSFNPENLDLQVLALSKFDLECMVKRYYRTLLAIADVECKENGEWCFQNRAIECEHNAARAVLEI